jgi:hypothetical protein
MLPQHPSNSPHPHSLTSLTPHTSAFRSPIALLSYHPNPTHESSAPGRGLMPGGARQLSAVRAPAQVPSPRGRPGWPSAPRRCDPGEVGPPSGGRRREDVRTPARLVVALSAPRSRRGTSVQPVERTSNVRCPVSRRPVFRCPDGQACAVRGTAAARSAVALDPEWLGVGDRRLGAVGRGAPGVRGRWSPASGLTGSDGAAVAAPGCPEVDRRPGPTLGRRPGCGAAWPSGRHGLVLGQGAGRVGEPGTLQVLTGPP